MKQRIPLLRFAPEMWKYQAFMKALLIPLLPLIRAAVLPALRLMDGERFPWTSFLPIPFALIALAVYFSADLNVKILCAANALDGSSESLFSTVKRGFAAVPKCGPAAFAHMALVAPVLAAGTLLFLRNATPFQFAAYVLFALIVAGVGVWRVFRPHAVLLDGLSVPEARQRAAALIRLRWRPVLRYHISYALSAFAYASLAGIALFVAPLSLGARILPARYGSATARSIMILVLFLNAAIVGAFALLASPRYVLGVTRIYRNVADIPRRASERHPALAVLALLYVLEIAAISSQTARSLDELFPPPADTRIVAHRGGGNETAENTRSGLETAIAMGAYGSEIDVQRTLDGHYIINHDPTFRRLAGESRGPEEMTLEEIKSLPYPVPTLEEMLDAAKGRITLFIELKGGTADEQMCDAAARMILERDMLEETVLISFDYDLMKYAERTFPDIRTGYLTAFFDGDASYFPFDYVGLEENVATPEMIRAVHEQGKKLLVWTPDAPETQERLFMQQADAIITNNVAQAQRVFRSLNHENDLEKILAAFR